jgi:hypothetical protein
VINAWEVEEVLRLIAAGGVTATEIDRSNCNIDRTFKTSTGWKIVIFDDCGQMDYIDAVEAPDGRKANFDDWVTEDANLNPMPGEWRDSHGDNPLGHALKWEENGDYRRSQSDGEDGK